jgi:UDP-N-acetylmuramate--alanine ligase
MMEEHIHFVGIGGTGLSAIARVLHEQGKSVSGSDRALTPEAMALNNDGVKLFIGHDTTNVNGASLVVRSSAVPDDNVEVLEARRRGIPVLKRAEFLSQMTANHAVIAIAGTHGKTTTTSMIAWMLTALGMDPIFIVGGKQKNLGTNARFGNGSYFVIEADEYDNMFLGLTPAIEVITNVEYDHPDCFPTPDDFSDAFRGFTQRLLPNGVLFACQDDIGAAILLQELRDEGRKGYSYGMKKSCDFRADNLSPRLGEGMSFDFYENDGFRGRIELQVPGTHNVFNALATLSVGSFIGLDWNEMRQSLRDFQGVGRRFEVRGEVGGVVVIDDYAHHPTEIRATINATRTRYPDCFIWVVWQPHTYSRFQIFFDTFISSFDGADQVIIADVFAARERIPAKFDIQEFVGKISHPRAIYLPDLESITKYLLKHLRSGDVLLTLSAGDANKISDDILIGMSR